MKVSIGPYPDDGSERQVRVDIIDDDVYSFDHTLAHIIYPGLKLLKTKKQSAPFVADEDVPENIRSTNAKPKENDWDSDEFWFDRWDYVIDEMIWAFEQYLKEDDEAEFFDLSEVNEEDNTLLKWFRKVKIDREGLMKHEARIQNGLRLFGKYFMCLWY